MKHYILAIFMVFGAFGQVQAQLPDLPNFELPDISDLPFNKDDAEDDAEEEKEDYSHLPPEAEKQAKLEKLFERLKDEEDADSANLIAEEIWAIWLNSGSASIDLLVRRASAAEQAGDIELARRLYDHVTTIKPDYAEGWARSGRLAFAESDYSRAVVEITEALVIEPRQFYALWTMGNILENLERYEEALKVYTEAHELYPAMEIIKSRKELMEAKLGGDVL